jgi:uncharacterized protein
MLSVVTILVAAMFSAALTMYSGFGLGTLLLPFFALFFPVEAAVAATAVVHFANNVLKVAMLGRFADWSVVIRFGLPAILAALGGAAVLGVIAGMGKILSYQLFGSTATITVVNGVLALLMAIFALFELLPALRSLRFERKHLVPGGLLSGFFGGLSGHQGALRSAFLVKAGMSTEAFVGTSAVIGMLVDLVRLAAYAALFAGAGLASGLSGEWMLLLAGIAGAFAGVFIAQRFLHKVTMQSVQILTGILLLLIAIGLGMGLI